MPPEKEGECVIAWCHEPAEDGRNKCAAHHRAKYECQIPGCKRLHYSNRRCHLHYCEERGLFMTQDGQPADLVGAAAYTQRRMNEEWETIIKLLHWEQQNRHEKS